MAKWHSRKELPTIIETGRSVPLLIQVRTSLGNRPYFSGRRHDRGDIHGWYIETPYDTVEEVTDKSVMRWAYMYEAFEELDVAQSAAWEKTEVDGRYACSKCGGDADHRTNYCPRCGTVMEW